ncbi:MAG: hypothetical protein IAF38_04400, partial [Bacteroidia bacterium]|nr:hypothetical protein [Bacteroidia bacterium]
MSEKEIIQLHKADKLIEQRLYLEAAGYLDTLYEVYPDDDYLCFITGLCMSYNPNKAPKA